MKLSRFDGRYHRGSVASSRRARACGWYRWPINDELDEMSDDYADGLIKARPGTRTTSCVAPAPRCRRAARRQRPSRPRCLGLRQVAKEQREQEQRQHEQQVRDQQAELRQLSQTLGAKQDPLIGLSRDNARLAAELSQAHVQFHQVQTEVRSLRDEFAVARESRAAGRGAGPALVAARGLQIEDLLRARNALEDMLTE